MLKFEHDFEKQAYKALLNGKSETKLVIAKFDGNYGRTGFIWIEQGFCDNCGAPVPVLKVDASEDEYNSGMLCFFCINEAFQKWDSGVRENESKA